MPEACVLVEKLIFRDEWITTIQETNEKMFLPMNPSAFPFGLKDLCESRINILCEMPSQPFSG